MTILYPTVSERYGLFPTSAKVYSLELPSCGLVTVEEMVYSLQVIAGERGAECRAHDFGRLDCRGIRYCNGSKDGIRCCKGSNDDCKGSNDGK